MPKLGLRMPPTRFPRPPGDVGHPATFALPVLRRAVHGTTPQCAVPRARPGGAAAPHRHGAGAGGRRLRRHRHRHRLRLSGAVAARAAGRAADAGVKLASLLQLADAPARRCDVITIEAASLTPAHLAAVTAFAAVRADAATPLEGITPASALHRALLQALSTLDEADAHAQVRVAGSAAGRSRSTFPVPAPAPAVGAGAGAERTSLHWCWSAPTCRPYPRAAHRHRPADAGRGDAAHPVCPGPLLSTG